MDKNHKNENQRFDIHSIYNPAMSISIFCYLHKLIMKNNFFAENNIFPTNSREITNFPEFREFPIASHGKMKYPEIWDFPRRVDTLNSDSIFKYLTSACD